MSARVQADLFTNHVDVNPRSFSEPIEDSDAVSFVPMKAIEAESGQIDASEKRTWKQVKRGYTPFQEGDVLFAKITPCMENGKYAVAKGLHGGRAAGSTEFYVFRPKPELLSSYILYFLFSPDVRRAAKRSMRGAAGQLRVPKSFFQSLSIPLTDVRCQAAVVDEIEKQFTRLQVGVDSLRNAGAKLKRYRATVLKAAGEGRLVPTEDELAKQEGRDYVSGSMSLEEVREAASGSLPGMSTIGRTELQGPFTCPVGWCWTSLHEVCELIGGLTKNPRRAALKYQLPYLRVANVYANELRLDDVATIGISASERSKLLLRKGDLLIVEGNGSKDQVGRVAVWDGSIDPCVHQNHVIKARPRDGLDARWLMYWLLSPIGREIVEREARSTSGLYTLSIGKAGRLMVPFPPLAEQARIVAELDRRLSVLAKLEATIDESLQRAARMRQAVLKNVFCTAHLDTCKETA
jgi:type I restriction enzyme S subunit